MSAAAEPGAGGVRFLPFLGETRKGRAHGAFVGFGLHTRAENLIRAVQEGVSYEIKAAVDQQREVANVKSLRVFGGGAKSQVWPQMIADMTGLPTSIPYTWETGCVGAAMCAAYALLGEEAGGALKRKSRAIFVPDVNTYHCYQKHFEDYRSLCQEILESKNHD